MDADTESLAAVSVRRQGSEYDGNRSEDAATESKVPPAFDQLHRRLERMFILGFLPARQARRILQDHRRGRHHRTRLEPLRVSDRVARLPPFYAMDRNLNTRRPGHQIVAGRQDVHVEFVRV